MAEVPVKDGVFHVLPRKRGKMCLYFNSKDVDLSHVARKYDRPENRLGIKLYFWNEKIPKDAKIMVEQQAIILNLGGIRVYGVEEFRYGDLVLPGLVMENVEGGHDACECQKVYEATKERLAKFDIKPFKDDYSEFDVVNNRLVDMDKFRIGDDFNTRIRNFVYEKGKWGKTHYQAIPELDIPEFRKTTDRIDYMKFDDVDFRGKTVMDVGCSSGVFLNEVVNRGAIRGYGVDTPDNVDAAFVLSTFLGNNNVDYKAFDLKNERPTKGTYDIVLMLSMDFHIGLPDWLFDTVGELMIFEKNSSTTNRRSEQVGEVMPILEKHFRKIEKVGEAKDHGNKPIYFCWK